MNIFILKNTLFFFIIISTATYAQQKPEVPPGVDLRMYDIIEQASPERLEQDIRQLAGFGTRNTLSDTVSDTRGIGAARRWIKQELDSIAADCNGCLEVFYQKDLVKAEGNDRIPTDTWVVNVAAIQRGTLYPNRYIIMSGDIDSRASDATDATTDAPGANDNASGMAGVLEAARLLTQYEFASSIVYLGLSGEEQGLYGGRGFAQYVQQQNWDIIGVLNNDMIGNIEGLDGVIDNRSFRIFSEPVPPNETEEQRTQRRFIGGEVDGISRQLARYVHKITETYMPYMNPMMIYRLDRFGRGGHHRPFNDLGYAGVRIMEAHENYNRQHQDIRIEDGIEYGDVIEGVNFPYAAKLTAVNAITMAGLAWAPPQPLNVRIGGAVQASTTLAWDKADAPNMAGYKVYWRETTAPQWQYARFVGDVSEFTLENIIIDNYYFGVAAVSKDGNESVVVFPSEVMR